MNVTVSGLALLCALCPALADVGVSVGLVIAVAGLQDAEKSNDAPDVDPRAVAEIQKMITELDSSPRESRSSRNCPRYWSARLTSPE